jgi:hypothetical protein
MKQIPQDSKLSKDLFAKRKVDNRTAMGVVLKAIPEGWIIVEGKAVKDTHCKCDVCGSYDIIEVPHMGINCNRCHPL